MIVLYRNGDKHEVGGVKCELQRFKNRELEARLQEGWAVDPLELKKSPESKPSKGEASNKQVREMAKEAGIENWEKGRISKLKEQLNEQD